MPMCAEFTILVSMDHADILLIQATVETTANNLKAAGFVRHNSQSYTLRLLTHMLSSFWRPTVIIMECLPDLPKPKRP